MSRSDASSHRAGSRSVGRYSLHDVIARGGMATIHVGTLLGAVGFNRTVAIKRLHEGFAQDPEFVAMLLDEARLAGRILHPNVVSTLDVVTEDGEVFLVMDYVAGESVGTLVKLLAAKGELIPLRILAAIVNGALSGLHAAHEARNERGEPLKIVHRDMSPQNILLGADGVARVIDFGVAKAAARIQVTQDGQVKGKLRYMAPEQVTGAELTRAIDIYATGVLLWELSTGLRLREGESTAQIALAILDGAIPSPLEALAAKGAVLDETQKKYLPALGEVIAKATAMAPEERYATAKDMARDLAERVPVSTAAEVADWIESIAGNELAAHAAIVAGIERESADASGESRPSQVMRALTASRPDPFEISISGATPSGISRSRRPRASGANERPSKPVPGATEEAAPPEKSPTTSQKTIVIAALLLCLGSFFLWRAEIASPTKPPSNPNPMPPVSAPLPAVSLDPLASSDAAIDPLASDASVATSVDAAPSASASSKAAPPSPPCQPFTYDEQGVKRYNPKCFK